MTPMKAILIDPTQHTVAEVQCDGSAESICRLIGANLLTTVNVGGGETLYVDDEGLLTYPHPHGYFRFVGYGQVFAGKGLIVGSNAVGDCVPTQLMAAHVRECVEFCEPTEEEVEPTCSFVE